MKKGILTLGLFLSLFLILKIFSFSIGGTESKTSSVSFENEHRYYTKGLDIPLNVSFAGERIPTEDFDIAERLDKELLINTYWQSQTILLFKRAHRWFPTIEKILKKNGIPEDFKFLALAESGLLNVVSPAGATGYWQFMNAAGKRYGLEMSEQIDERYHMEKSTEAACKYLREAYVEFGSWTMAAASYNMGIEGLKKQRSQQNEISYFDLFLNEETSRYIFRLVALKEVLSNPEKYNFKIEKKHLYPPVPVTLVYVDTSISSLVDFASFKGVSYKALRHFNPWLRQYSLNNPTGKSYIIQLPDTNFSYRKYVETMAYEDSMSSRKK